MDSPSRPISAEELSCFLFEEVCHLHGEKLELICLEDKQPLCLVCKDSQEHVNHTFTLISEVASSYKDELEAALYYLHINLKDNECIKEEFEDTIQHIEALERVRVYLDYGRGTVSFSDPVTNTHLHTFTTTFTDTVLPFFGSIYHLQILPINSQ